MEPDGNCFFRCVSDQLNHDNGAGHDFTRHQLTSHISRHGNKFKNFLLLGDDHKDITDLDNYVLSMGQNGTWGGHTEVYVAAWFKGSSTRFFKFSNGLNTISELSNLLYLLTT
jgi:hypothetical protein